MKQQTFFCTAPESSNEQWARRELERLKAMSIDATVMQLYLWKILESLDDMQYLLSHTDLSLCEFHEVFRRAYHCLLHDLVEGRPPHIDVIRKMIVEECTNGLKIPD